MSDCCSILRNQLSYPKKHVCPVNGKAYGLVSSSTIKHHIKKPWAWVARDQGYYFCSDPDCSVVYFGQDDSIIEKDSVRTQVGVKDNSDSSLICYCYGVTRAEAENTPQIRQFVIEETKHHHCACEAKNPSGKCCLAEFTEP